MGFLDKLWESRINESRQQQKRQQQEEEWVATNYNIVQPAGADYTMSRKDFEKRNAELAADGQPPMEIGRKGYSDSHLVKLLNED